MTGIEILSAQEVVTKYAYNWKAFWILFAVIIGVFITFGLIASVITRDHDAFVIITVSAIIFGLMFGGLYGTATSYPIAYETQYKVTTSDEVSMNEFLEKYEIIDQEGKIFTIRERSIEEDLQ